jgi:polysaccharide export outer membrane protein
MKPHSHNITGRLSLLRCAQGAAWMSAAVLIGACSSNNNGTISFAEFMAMQNGAAATTAAQDAGGGPAAATERASRIDTAFSPFRIGGGDTLVVNLVGTGTEIPPTLRARAHEDGTIMLPLTGPIQIGGMSLEEAEKAVHRAYVPTYVRDLTVNIEVGDFESTDVLVTGAVQVPGLIRLRRDQRTLVHAVVAAGGVTDATSGSATLERIRRPSDKITYDLTKREHIETALSDAPLEDGDIIRVEGAMPNMIFVGGLVAAPAPQTYPAGAKVRFLQALAAAGGPRMDLQPDEARLIRHMPDGRDLHVKLDLTRLQMGQDENFALASGDIIWVPHTSDTRLREFVQNTFFLRAGVSAVYDPIQYEFTRQALDQDNNEFADSINDGLRYGLQNAFFPVVQP